MITDSRKKKENTILTRKKEKKHDLYQEKEKVTKISSKKKANFKILLFFCFKFPPQKIFLTCEFGNIFQSRCICVFGLQLLFVRHILCLMYI